MSEETASPEIIWVRRGNTGVPNTALANKILRDARTNAYVGSTRSTASHLAIIVGGARTRAAAITAITNCGWTIDADYAPPESEPSRDDDFLRRISDRPARPRLTVSGPLIDELFGEQPRRRVIGGWRSF